MYTDPTGMWIDNGDETLVNDSIEGDIFDFAGKSQYNSVHLIARVDQKGKDMRFSLEIAVGGGAYWGNTFIIPPKRAGE